MEAHQSVEPSSWVRRFVALIPPGGRTLDLACGGGRHARLLAALGHEVDAVDRDAAALGALADVPRVTVCVADLEGRAWPYPGCKFSGIVVANYLHRPLLPRLLASLESDGVLIYETFMAGNERFGKPTNPAFLLRPDELLELVRGELAVVAFEQGEIATPRAAVVQRICAVRGAARLLLG